MYARIVFANCSWIGWSSGNRSRIASTLTFASRTRREYSGKLIPASTADSIFFNSATASAATAFPAAFFSFSASTLFTAAAWRTPTITAPRQSKDAMMMAAVFSAFDFASNGTCEEDSGFGFGKKDSKGFQSLPVSSRASTFGEISPAWIEFWRDSESYGPCSAPSTQRMKFIGKRRCYQNVCALGIIYSSCEYF